MQAQTQGVQAEPVVANGENLLNMPCTNDTHTPMLTAFSNELDSYIQCTHINTNNIKQKPPTTQMGVTTNRTLFYVEIYVRI